MKDGAYDADDDDFDLGTGGDGHTGGVKRRRRNDGTASSRGASDHRREDSDSFSPLFHAGVDTMGESDIPHSSSSSGQNNRYGASAPHHLISPPAQVYHANFAGSIDRFVRAMVACFDPQDRDRDGGGDGDRGGRSGESNEASGSGGVDSNSGGGASGGSTSGGGAGGGSTSGGGAGGVYSPSKHGLLPLALLCTPTSTTLTYPACDITPSHIDILDTLWAQAEEEDHTARALEVGHLPTSPYPNRTLL